MISSSSHYSLSLLWRNLDDETRRLTLPLWDEAICRNPYEYIMIVMVRQMCLMSNYCLYVLVRDVPPPTYTASITISHHYVGMEFLFNFDCNCEYVDGYVLFTILHSLLLLLLLLLMLLLLLFVVVVVVVHG